MGDSIVEKVFAGLQASDTVVVVLSRESVRSKWVNEELSVATMRRIAERSVRVAPVLIETCDIPAPLLHLRYADFRCDYDAALAQLLDVVAPGNQIWDSLAHHLQYFDLLCNAVARAEEDEAVDQNLLKLHSLLETALNLRAELEFREATQRVSDQSFLEKIGALAQKGVDARSQTWEAFLIYQAHFIHAKHSGELRTLREFAKYVGKDDNEASWRLSAVAALGKLKDLMTALCTDRRKLENVEYDA